MTLGDLFEQSLVICLLLLALLMLIGAVRLRPGRLKGLGRREKLGRLARYAGTRLPLAIGAGVAFFVLGAAALTLNSHRPPADSSPVITLPDRSGEAVVSLKMGDCSGDVTGQARYTGRLPGNSGKPRIYSDQDGRKRLKVREHGLAGAGSPATRRAAFTLNDPVTRRGLLSCYLQLPVLKGTTSGYEVRLATSGDMEIDTMASVPTPDAYDRGEWIWRCPAGQSCPALATVAYAVEDGAKQVIVLVLAAVFGALIALLAGEALIKLTRRRFGNDGT